MMHLIGRLLAVGAQGVAGKLHHAYSLPTPVIAASCGGVPRVRG
ncbi:MAG: hypothetical protein WC505_07985 [Patescibacteria group bacterium]